MDRLLVALAGLPGSGKSTLARALAPALDAALLDKDRVRAALFAPEDVAHTREQDDLCFRALLEAAGWLLREGRRAVLLDGRTFTRAESVAELLAFGRALGLVPRVLLCTCSDEVARARLAADAGRHPAANRGFELHQRLKAEGQPLVLPHLVVRTDEGTTEGHVRDCLRWLSAGPRGAGPSRRVGEDGAGCAGSPGAPG